MDNLLEIKDLQIATLRGRDSVLLLDKVSLNIGRRQNLGIVGESGCGKSITASALLQLLPYPLSVTQGSARFDSSLMGEVDLLGLPSDDIRRLRGREVAMVFQEPMTSLDPIFTIESQMFEALQFHFPGLGQREMRERCQHMLAKVNIPRADQTLASYPHQLSGGQLQRILIAIALLNSPRLLIADEPTTALDVTIQAQILDLMNELREAHDASIVMITHDLGVIAETSEHVAVFYAGHVVEEAPVAELFHHPQHPYTRGLLKAIRSLDGDPEHLYAIPGIVPAGGQWEGHCRFAARCDQRMPMCLTAQPALVELAPGHLCRCFLHSQEVEA